VLKFIDARERIVDNSTLLRLLSRKRDSEVVRTRYNSGHVKGALATGVAVKLHSAEFRLSNVDRRTTASFLIAHVAGCHDTGHNSDTIPQIVGHAAPSHPERPQHYGHHSAPARSSYRCRIVVHHAGQPLTRFRPGHLDTQPWMWTIRSGTRSHMGDDKSDICKCRSSMFSMRIPA